MPEFNGVGLAVALALSGLTLVAGCWKLVSAIPVGGAGPTPPAPPALTRQQLLMLLGILALALVLRATGLEDRGMTHVEVYVPGIDLPEEIAEPVPRIGLATTVQWHYFREPHPPAYYLAGWVWTRIFGTELTALRAPSVLFGVGGVLLLFLLGRRVGTTNTALLAALLLAVHGHHAMWSQWARMYAMGTFLGLGSVILYLKLLGEAQPRRSLSILYVAVTLAMLATQTLLWTLLAAQILHTFWVGRHGSQPGRAALLTLEFPGILIAVPLISQAAFLARPSPFLETPLGITRDFFGFGFLFVPDPAFEKDWVGAPWFGALVVSLLGGALALLGLRRSDTTPFAETPESAPTPNTLTAQVLIALGVSGLILAMSMNYRVWQRQEVFAATALIPWVFVAGHAALPLLSQWMGRLFAPRFQATNPIPWFVLAPIGLLLLLSPWAHLLTSRGLLFGVPFLLLLIAQGVLGTAGILRGGLLAGVLALNLLSLVHHDGFEEVVDYRGLAAQVREAAQPQDLFLVHPADWLTTPIFYDLNHRTHQFVAEAPREALVAAQAKRVWTLQFADVPPSPEIQEALCGFRPASSLRTTRAEAILYLEDPDQKTHCKDDL